jgi:hypothetical protein
MSGMESGFATPLLEFFMRGEVTPEVKLLAAQGALAPRAHEQLGLLVLLVGDADPIIASTAETTLQAISREAIAAFLARPDAPSELKTFFAARGIEPAAAALDNEAALIDTSPKTDEVDDDKDDEGTALQRLQKLNVPQKVQRATKGSREERAILIRDSNKMIAMAVLSSPKLTISEIEGFARAGNVGEDCLRVIARTRAWMKNYNVVAALTRNPKTPVALSMNLLSRLTEKDLRTLSTDRNVADVLRVTARKKLVLGKE